MHKWDQRLDVALACYSLKPGSTNIKLAPCRADKEEEYATPLIARLAAWAAGEGYTIGTSYERNAPRPTNPWRKPEEMVYVYGYGSHRLVEQRRQTHGLRALLRQARR